MGARGLNDCLMRNATKSYTEAMRTAPRMDDTTAKDVKFLDCLRADRTEPYRGEWVAIYDGGVVAHGKDPELVACAARKAGVRSPLMEYFFDDPSEVPYHYMVPP